MSNISYEEDTCLKECEGLVVDITKGEPSDVDERREVAELYEDYERFKTRNISRLDYSGYMKGRAEAHFCLALPLITETLSRLGIQDQSGVCQNLF